MELREIEIENFKAIDKCKFELTSVTLLVGANNAGKSSILQAIHFASSLLRSASSPNNQSTLSISAADYIPTENYKELANGNKSWGNSADAPEGKVSFTFKAEQTNEEGENEPIEHGEAVAELIVKAARNEGLSLSPTIPNVLNDRFRRERFFSAYIPGLAGIPLQEQFLTKKHVFKKVASGDSNVVLRNILLMIKEQGKEGELLEILNEVYPDLSLSVNFDGNSDYFIQSDITFKGKHAATKPLEFSGTGFLQVVQIFSYLVLFRPTILLIDEPESHLHPTLQVKLIRALEKKARDIGSIALITTHSPFVARGLPLESRTIWVKDGNVVASTIGEEIKQALGWGAIDKKYILCTEDGDLSWLNKILFQKEEVFDRVSVVPFEGVSKLGSGGVVKNFKKALGDAHTVIVHRDRDCMSDEELSAWRDEMTNKGLIPWITDGSDVEAYFCEPKYVAKALSISELAAGEIVDAAITENKHDLHTEFRNKRREVIGRLYRDGGAPETDDLWRDWENMQKLKGKTLIKKIRTVVRRRQLDEKRIGKIVDDWLIAGSLFDLLSDNEN